MVGTVAPVDKGWTCRRRHGGGRPADARGLPEDTISIIVLTTAHQRGLPHGRAGRGHLMFLCCWRSCPMGVPCGRECTSLPLGALSGG